MTTDTQSPQYLTAPGPHQQPLGVFVGAWNATWTITLSPTAPPITTIGTDTFEWVEGVFAILHRSTAYMGEHQQYNVADLIGYDAPSDSYRSYSFDNQANVLAFDVTVQGNTWTFKGATQRATIVTSDDGHSITAHWEQSEDGATWVPWIEVAYTRVS